MYEEFAHVCYLSFPLRVAHTCWDHIHCITVELRLSAELREKFYMSYKLAAVRSTPREGAFTSLAIASFNFQFMCIIFCINNTTYIIDSIA